jgi:hypothetical protein
VFDTGGVEDTPEPDPPLRALLAATQHAVTGMRRAYREVLDLIAALDTAGAAAATGHRSLGRLLEELIRVGPAEAGTWLREARLLCGRPDLPGEAGQPVLAATAAALAAGELGPGHLAVITETMTRIRRLPHVDPPTAAETERQLVGLARERSATQLRRDAHAVLLLLDPDGQIPPDADRPAHELEMSSGRDGSLRGTFRFADPEAAETVRTAIDALTPPPDPDTDTTTLRPGRTLAARRGTALHDLAAAELGLTDNNTAHDTAHHTDNDTAHDTADGDTAHDAADGEAADDVVDDEAVEDEAVEDAADGADGAEDADRAPVDPMPDDDEATPGPTRWPDDREWPHPAEPPEDAQWLDETILDLDWHWLDQQFRELTESWPAGEAQPPPGHPPGEPPPRLNRRSGEAGPSRPGRTRTPGTPRTPRTQGGDAVHVTVTVPLSVLRGDRGDRDGPAAGEQPFGLLDGQWAISAETARRLACDAQIIPVVLGARGEVLDLDRKSRVVSAAQRRALVQRDRHCAHPGCRRRPRRCAAHHIVPWGQGGPTDVDNLVLT